MADKVLLFDPTTKTGQHSKLKRRWSGPYLITEVLDNFNSKLQELETGRVLKRPVHADRLRPLKELQNDYRLPIPDTLQQTFQCTTAQRNLAVRILVGDILSATAHAITHVTGPVPSQQNALSQRLFDTAGAGVLQTFRQHIDENAPLTTGDCFITPAGNLNPIRRIVHINSSCDSDKVQAETSNCLQTVDTHQDNISSIVIPFFDSLGSNTFWDIAQQYAKAVNDFDAATTEPKFLTKIDFVCRNLTAASVLQTVFKHTIKTVQQNATDIDIGTPTMCLRLRTNRWLLG
jgi:O-acetyl-ADP-ribose deacetylase (regulator of RNase III)